MVKKDDDPLSWLVAEAVQQLGLETDPGALAARVARLQRGLPAEDEFSSLLIWMGRCRLVHKLDQLQRPKASKRNWQVPDLLALFSYKRRLVPFLIEVKATKHDETRLSMSVAYHRRLTGYAKALNLPLLIAWRWGSFWILFDAKLLKPSPTAYKVDVSTAMTETLMCELAGDFSFLLRKGSGLHIKIRKQERRGAQLIGTIEEAYWSNADGKRFANAPGVFPLFLGIEQESRTTEDESHVTISYVVGSTPTLQFGSRALSMLAAIGTGGKGPNWRTLLEKVASPAGAPRGLRNAVLQAQAAGFVEHLIAIAPKSNPVFLGPRRKAAPEPPRP